MNEVATLMKNTPPNPSDLNQRALWECDGQALAAAVIEGVGNHENWTHTPKSEQNLNTLSYRFSRLAKEWGQLNQSIFENIISVLTSLELGPAYYLMTWLHYNVDSPAILDLIKTAQRMKSEPSESNIRAGRIMIDRLFAITKINSIQCVLKEALKQKVLSHA